jgi:hypothetical protein
MYVFQQIMPPSGVTKNQEWMVMAQTRRTPRQSLGLNLKITHDPSFRAVSPLSRVQFILFSV